MEPTLMTHKQCVDSVSGGYRGGYQVGLPAIIYTNANMVRSALCNGDVNNECLVRAEMSGCGLVTYVYALKMQ